MTVQESCYENFQRNPLLSFSTFLESNNISDCKKVSAVEDVCIEMGFVENFNDITIVLSILFYHRIVKYVFYIR